MGPVLKPDIFILLRKNVFSSLLHTVCIIGIDNEINVFQPSACQQCVLGAGISVCVYSGKVFRKTVIIFAVSLVLADLA